MKKILIIQFILLSFETYGQTIDTTFYFDKSVRMITSETEDEKTVLAFFNIKGENLIAKNTFDYTFFDDDFNMNRIIRIENRKIFEDYWLSNTDTIYNEFIFDSDFQKHVVPFLNI